MGQRKVGDPEDSREPFFDGLVRNRVRQDHANPAAKILDASDAEVFQRPLDIAHEPLLEIVPVAAFEGEFVVMDDGAAHGYRDAENSRLLTRPTPARRDAPFRGHRSRVDNILNVSHLGRAVLAAQGSDGWKSAASGVCLACGLVGRPF